MDIKSLALSFSWSTTFFEIFSKEFIHSCFYKNEELCTSKDTLNKRILFRGKPFALFTSLLLSDIYIFSILKLKILSCRGLKQP